jgi:hypothetical protein
MQKSCKGCTGVSSTMQTVLRVVFHIRADGIRGKCSTPSTRYQVLEYHAQWFVLHALLSGFFTNHAAPFARKAKRTRFHKR